MAIENLPPPCGEVEIYERSENISDGGPLYPPGTAPHPKFAPQISTSPQGGGENIVAIARSWIGTPYIHQASVRGAGCDCLGLLRGVWRELHGDEPEIPPPYSPDWSEASGTETLYRALKRHLTPIARAELAPGDVALFRMSPRGPAKHCGIVGAHLFPSPECDRRATLTLIHARQNRRVSEEPFAPFWAARLAHVFRL